MRNGQIFVTSSRRFNGRAIRLVGTDPVSFRIALRELLKALKETHTPRQEAVDLANDFCQKFKAGVRP